MTKQVGVRIPRRPQGATAEGRINALEEFADAANRAFQLINTAVPFHLPGGEGEIGDHTDVDADPSDEAALFVWNPTTRKYEIDVDLYTSLLALVAAGPPPVVPDVPVLAWSHEFIVNERHLRDPNTGTFVQVSTAIIENSDGSSLKTQSCALMAVGYTIYVGHFRWKAHWDEGQATTARCIFRKGGSSTTGTWSFELLMRTVEAGEDLGSEGDTYALAFERSFVSGEGDGDMLEVDIGEVFAADDVSENDLVRVYVKMTANTSTVTPYLMSTIFDGALKTQ